MIPLELKQTQKIVYQVLSNALLSDKVSQGYLFIGSQGSKMLEAAILLAQSLVCKHADEDGFACGTCDSCARIADGNFVDLMILDGSEKSIKKEEILHVRETFSKTALEAYGKKIYIINACENATPEALNALLKFLEEPSGDIYAILITNRIESLLETIISRVQNIKFRPLSIETSANEAVLSDISKEDADLLSRIVSNSVWITETAKQDSYLEIKTFTYEFIQLFLKSKQLAALEMQQFIKNHKQYTKAEYLLLINLLIVYCKECICPSFVSEEEHWNELVEKGSARDVQGYMRILLEIKDDLQRNLNLALIFDKLMYRLRKECE